MTDAEDYIERYGANLTEADKRYIRAFGAPVVSEGPARNPYTPGMRIVDAPDDRTDLLGVRRPGARRR